MERATTSALLQSVNLFERWRAMPKGPHSQEGYPDFIEQQGSSRWLVEISRVALAAASGSASLDQLEHEARVTAYNFGFPIQEMEVIALVQLGLAHIVLSSVDECPTFGGGSANDH